MTLMTTEPANSPAAARDSLTATPQQQQWADDYADGYRVGRGDARFAASPRMHLVEVPYWSPDITGAEYVEQHAGNAWAIGYTRGYTWRATW